MKIKEIKIGMLEIPLKKPFKTALRELETLETIIIEMHTDKGNIGYGEASITPVITGDFKESIIYAIKNYIGPSIVGMEINDIDNIMKNIEGSIIGNNSAKAAVDIAVYDLYAQLHKKPLYKILGNYMNEINTDITISINNVEEMVLDSKQAVDLGYEHLKIKLGKDYIKDIERLKAIRQAVGYDISIRVDANQGWTREEAVHIINAMESEGLNIELFEQPLKAHDLEGLKFVKDRTKSIIVADESCFSFYDAKSLLDQEAVHMLNIKLMKTGGIHNAKKIVKLSEEKCLDLMIGCMMESKVGLTAAISLAVGSKNITKYDLDSPNLLKEDPVVGGAIYNEKIIKLSDKPGLGIETIENIKYIG